VTYAFKPFAGSSHHWALDEVDRLPPGRLKVLDVGAGEGHLTAAVLAARPGEAEVWAVEPHPERAGALREVAHHAVEELEQVEERGFDLALLLDVLEHVPDPAEFLGALVDRLRPGGVALISVPNVAHWSVRGGLLLGRFDYTDRGILDRTHLRFFTRKTLLATLSQAGLQVEATSSSVVPLELLLPEPLTRNPVWAAATSARQTLARAWPGPWAYQLLARVRRAP
jgi:2-polyprenyl-3-methyl-5-hydroxy-6-metoxy-1,4-benzoquinol methylase